MPLATPDVVEAAPEVAQVVQAQGAPVDSTMVEIGVPEIESAESEASEADAPSYSEDFRMVPQSTETELTAPPRHRKSSATMR
jgi:hypothetical protein